MRRIEDWSRTRWVISSLLIGLAVAYVRMQAGLPDPDVNTTPAKLEERLLRQPILDADNNAYPWAKHVRLYPSTPAMTREGIDPEKKLAIVTSLLLEVHGNEFVYRPSATRFEEPMQAPTRRFAGEPMTTREYLDKVSAQAERQVYAYTWWLEPQWVYLTSFAIPFLLIGVAWPIVLDRLIVAGYGRRSESLSPSLWARLRALREERARRGASAASDPMLKGKPTPAPTTMSEEDLARLAAMEEGLKGFVVSQSPVAGEEAAPAPAPVRELNAQPLETQAGARKPEEEKSYGGEFYPTVAHAKRTPPPSGS